MIKSLLKYIVIGMALGVCAGALTNNANAEETVITYEKEVGKWTVWCGAHAGTKEFSFCSMSSSYELHPDVARVMKTKHVSVSFTLYRDFARVGFMGGWKAPDGMELDGWIKFDNSKYEGNFKYLSLPDPTKGGMVLSSTFDDIYDFMVQAMLGKYVEAEIGGKQTGKFPLNGSAVAGAHLLDVWAEKSGGTFGSGARIDKRDNYTFGKGKDRVDTF